MFIRLNVEHRDWCRAVLLLEAASGQRFLPAEGAVYEFATSAARDDVLDRLRSRFGWTVATAFDGDPWVSGRDSRGAESRDGRAIP